MSARGYALHSVYPQISFFVITATFVTNQTRFGDYEYPSNGVEKFKLASKIEIGSPS